MSLDIRVGLAAVSRTREEQKINQEEAAERCGLHRTYYTGIERGVTTGLCPVSAAQLTTQADSGELLALKSLSSPVARSSPRISRCRQVTAKTSLPQNFRQTPKHW
jgi:transcriptional regulator with XRE-family HTH domain